MPAFDRNSIDQGTEDPSKDLGFGSEVARGSHTRLLNRDGTFNVARFGLHPFSSLSIYHWSLSTTWPRFLGMLAVAYLCINTLFAFGYIACGINALQGEFVTTPIDIFLRAFFFSVQTFATIGYGHVIATGTLANVLVTLEAFLNIVGVALATGVVFARFSRPTAKIIYSHNAVVAPYKGITALEFRIANARSSQIIELEAKVILSRIEASAEGLVRKFRDLKLERTSVTFFPLSWTLVHPIDEQSPLTGMNHEDLLESNAEILILLTGTDETSSQTVHSRSSYKAEEIVWNAAFAPIFKRGRDDGILGMDVGMIHDYVKTGMGTETVQVFVRKPSQ
jgi:inward rectifier potassium channel